MLTDARCCCCITAASGYFRICIFARSTIEIMAGVMQMNFDLRSLLQDDKNIKVDAVKKSHEEKALSLMSKGKNIDPLRIGKHVRDLHAELLIPQHITGTWKFQFDELRALK